MPLTLDGPVGAWSREVVGRLRGAAVGATVLLTALVALPVSSNASAMPTITLSNRIVPQTAPVIVSGTGFAPHAPVTIRLDTATLARGSTTTTGSLRMTIRVPASVLPGWHRIVATTASAKASIALAVRNSWRQLGHDARHDGNVVENLITPATVAAITPIWSQSGGNDSQAVVVNGEVVIGIGNTVQAFDAADGHHLWTFDTGDSVYDTPAVAAGLVLVGSYNDKFYALDLETGAERWHYQADTQIVTSPAATESVVVVPLDDESAFVALRVSDGSVLWTKKFGGQITAVTPTISGSTVYVGDSDIGASVGGHLAALNLTDGSTIWRVSVDGVADRLPIDNGTLYARGVYTGVITAVRASDGSVLWSHATGVQGYLSPSTDGQRVYAPVANGLTALDARTGDALWTYQPGAFTLDATIAGGVVYSATISGITFALDAATGAPLWSANDAGQPYRAPTVVDGTVYVNGTKLVAYQLPTPLG